MDPQTMEQMQAMRAAQAGAGVGVVGGLIYLAVMAFFIYCGWKLFVKAGQPGWAVIVPIYNILIMLKIVGRPAWWIVLMFIPIANLIVAIIVTIDLAKSFGKSTGFGVGLLLLGFIFCPILALGSSKYVGPAAAGAAPAAAKA